MTLMVNCPYNKPNTVENPCEAMLRALKVFVLNEQHRRWMLENDPKALEQAEFAIELAELSTA